MKKSLITAMTLTLMAGCTQFEHSEAPLATNFATSKQMKLQAAHHWQVIASDMADTLIETLKKGTTCIAPTYTCASVYIEPPNQKSPFGRAFHNQFVSHLVNQGVNIVIQRPADVEITIDAQTVKFTPKRSQYLSAFKFSLISGGLWGLHAIGEEYPSAAAFTAAVITDAYQWNTSEFAKGPTPEIELILTTSAKRAGHYLARATNVYYIADSDANLYCWKEEGCEAKIFVPPPPALLQKVGDCVNPPCNSPSGN